MPSLRMKTKSKTGCLNGKKSPHVCRKSCMISKNPLSPTRIPQNVEEVGAYIQNSLHASFKVYARETAENETNHDEFFDVEIFLQKQQFNEPDSAAVNNLDPAPSTCASNVETIFSPILESLDFRNDEGSDHICLTQLNSHECCDVSSRNQCEFQACNASELYISDIIFPGPYLESNSTFDDKTDPMSWLDHKCKQSTLLSDVADEYRILPFLEDTFDAAQNHDDRTSGEAIMDEENPNLCYAIHQLRPGNHEAGINTCNDPDYESFDPQMYIRNVPCQPDVSLCYLSDKKAKHSTRQITLVLDLDETLVHSTLDHCEDADFTFPVFFNMKEHTVYVKKRPHLHDFLKSVAEMFNIMVFTASQSIYAKQLLDILDPEGNLLSKRAYRESCTILEGNYVKDLTVFGVDLAKIAIIDNSPQVFKLQVNNGIPIRSWFDDPTDCALVSLLPFLETLVDVDDVRPIIAMKFGNKE